MIAAWNRHDGAISDLKTQIQVLEIFSSILADSKHLDPQPGGQGYSAGFAVFGRVVSGISVAETISRLPTQTRAGLKMLVEGVAFSASVSKSPN